MLMAYGKLHLWANARRWLPEPLPVERELRLQRQAVPVPSLRETTIKIEKGEVAPSPLCQRQAVRDSEDAEKIAIRVKARLPPLENVTYRRHLIGNVSKYNETHLTQMLQAAELAPDVMRQLTCFFDYQGPSEFLERGEEKSVGRHSSLKKLRGNVAARDHGDLVHRFL